MVFVLGVKSGLISIRRKVNNGNIRQFLHPQRRLYAIKFSFEINVEQYDIGFIFFHMNDRLFSTGQDASYFVAKAGELHGNFRTDNHFVFYDQDFNQRIHQWGYYA